MFALSAQTYLIEYHPDESLVGADAIDADIEVAKLEDGTTSWMTLDGEPLYCHVSPIDDMYYIQAVPASDMNASTMVTVGVILFAFTAVVAAVALYGIFVLRDDERRGEAGAGRCEGGRPAINRRIAKKAAVLSAVGFIDIIVISFYMQTLFALSSQSLAMTERVEQIAQTIKTSQDRASDLEGQYNERYLSKAQVAAYILDRNPEPATREKLQELADALQIEYLFTFDSSGRVTATNSTFTNFMLSEDPEDQSYGFRKLMQGVESYVQPAGPDEVSGELRQYIGVVTHDADGIIDGFVQLGIRPTRLETLLEPVQIDHVLDGVCVGADGALMAERVSLTVATAGIALVCLAVIFCLMVVEPKPGADGAWRRATHIGAQALDEMRPGRLSLPGASRYPHAVCVREILEAVATMVAAEAAAPAAVAATAAEAAAVVVGAHGDERLDDLVEHLDDLLGGIGGEGRDEHLALVAHGLGELLGILAREDDALRMSSSSGSMRATMSCFSASIMRALSSRRRMPMSSAISFCSILSLSSSSLRARRRAASSSASSRSMSRRARSRRAARFTLSNSSLSRFSGAMAAASSAGSASSAASTASSVSVSSTSTASSAASVSTFSVSTAASTASAWSAASMAV